MKIFVCAFALVASCVVLNAQGFQRSTGVSAVMPGVCSEVQETAFQFLAERRIETMSSDLKVVTPAEVRESEFPWSSVDFCEGCYLIRLPEEEPLLDADGKVISKTKVAMRMYAERPRIMGFPFLHLFDSFGIAFGRIQFTAVESGCEVLLRFEYAVMGTAYLIILPVERDSVLLTSNNVLEEQYLAEIQRRLSETE